MKKIYSMLLLAAAFIISVTVANAQLITNYSFATNATSSLALDINSNAIDMSTGTTQLIGPGLNSVGSNLADIGFGFWVMGTRHTVFNATSHGLMGLTTAINTGNNISGGGTTPRIGALTIGIAGTNMATHSTGKVHYKLFGLAPNRVLVVEWLNMSINSTSTNADATFQTRLYEATGVIEHVYGSISVSVGGPIGSVKAGFSNSTTVHYTVDFATNTANTTSNYVNTVANGPVSTLTSSADGSRRAFSFTPPSVVTAPTAPVTFSAISTFGMTVNWSAAAPTTGVYKYAVSSSSDGGVTYNYINTTNVGTNSLVVTGLNHSTAYTFKVESVNEGVLSSPITGTQSTLVPSSISSTGIGGLWSSAATWVGGVVPNGDDVTIADGAIVTVDQVVTIRDLTVGAGASGILQWNGTANALTVQRNVVVNTGANLNMFTAAAAPNGVTINTGGNFTNNGTVHAAYVNANHAYINFNNAAANSTLTGSGNFVGGIISLIGFQTLGNNAITTNQNLTSRGLNFTGGSLNTNGKLSINNTAQVFGQAFNQQVYEVVVTTMGTGYNSATPPTVTIAAPTGTGVTATAIPNIDDATGTLRSITITNAGDGYRANPVVTFTGGTGTGAVATAVVNIHCLGTTIATTQKSGSAVITGGINIKSDQSVGGLTTSSGGLGYTTAPEVGFALPFGYQNLVTDGGSGYTSAPTVTLSGGTALTGSTNPTFTVVVAQGKVVSVIAAGGGTLWQVAPTLTITGGGGAGATAAYPANCLATATASISNGMVNNFTVTNGGFGYTAAPAVALVGAAGTPATAPVSRVGLYNLTLSWFSPQVANTVHPDDAAIPANRRINALTMGAGGANFSGNVELYASAPITLTSGLVDMGANTLNFSHPAYAGTTGSTTSSVSGNIILNTPGGSLTRTFPYDASLVVVAGTGSLLTGSTVTTLTASRTTAPSGSVSPAGNTTGTRAYRLQTNAGAVYGTNPTVTMNFNATDALVSDNISLFVGQSTSLTGPWNIMSLATGSGALPVTGSRTTATALPGPIVPTGNDYFAWVNNSPVNSVTSGNWNDGATWSGGVVPGCGDIVQIMNTHNVTVNSAGNVSKSLIITAGGTLSVVSGSLTIGCTLNNNSLAVNSTGTLTVSGGTLNINGNLAVVAGAFFNQSAGNINIDGNAAGVTANSVASGTFIVAFTASNATDINLTGGVLTIVDPHAAATKTFDAGMTVAGAINTGVGHTFKFGDGISTDDGSASGFQAYQWTGTGLFAYGNVVIEQVSGGLNRFVNLTTTYSTMVANGDITINNGGELRQTATTINGAVIAGGNIIVNTGGTLTIPGILYFGKATAASGTTLTLSSASNTQSINGSGLIRNSATTVTANLASLTIDNSSPSGVTLNMPLSVSGAFTLTAGVLNTSNTNLLTLGYNAANTGSIVRTAGMVNGPVKKWFATSTGSTTFPLGSNTIYKPATINYTSAPSVGGTLTASFSAVAPNFPNASALTEGALTINKASNQGSWFIDLADGLSGGIYTATFTGNGTTDIIDFTKTVLIKRPSVGGDWVLDGTHVTTTGSNAAPVLSRTGMTGFSEYAIGGEFNVVLPISISYFRGSKQSAGNLLDWKISCTGSPYATLVLERSADGRNFKVVNSQEATALRCLSPFNFTDAAALAGMNFYRLKMVDADGKIAYSHIVALLNSEKGYEIVSMMPNPVREKAILTISSAVKSTMDLVITDLNGKQLSKQRTNLIAGSNQLALNLSNLAAGSYQATAITAEGVIKSIRFIKQ